MKDMKFIVLVLGIFILTGGIFVQYRTNSILQVELRSLQARNQELEDTVEFSQLITDDLRSELQTAGGQSKNAAKASALSDTIQCEKTENLSSIALFQLEAQKSQIFDPTRIRRQARITTDTLYTDFINSHLGRDAERRLKVRNILRKLEEQRIQALLDYIFTPTNETIDLNSLNRTEYEAKIDEELSEVFNSEELIALNEYRVKEIPIVIRRDMKNSVDKYAKGLTSESKTLMIDALSDIKLLELSRLGFEDSLNRHLDATKALQDKITTMEASQSLIAKRFYFNYIRNPQQLTQMLLAQRIENEN